MRYSITSGPSIVPVEKRRLPATSTVPVKSLGTDRWGNNQCGSWLLIVSAAAIVPVLLAGAKRHHRRTTTEKIKRAK